MTTMKKSKITKNTIPEKLCEDTISNDMSYDAPSDNIHSLPYAWDNKEDNMLCNLVYQYGTGNWELIAQNLGSKKTPIQCLHRWNSIMKPALVKGPWNVEEDKKLIDWIKTNGASNWSACSEFIPGRTGKQCRERWMNALNPLLKKGSWEPEEDYIIFKLFKKLGSKWSTISNYIAGRTENSIKNRFYSTLRRIASETRKNEKNIDNNFNIIKEKDDKAEQKLSLSKLMDYFNIAYIEKTKYIDSLIANLKLSENEILNSSVLKEILNMSNKDIKDTQSISMSEKQKSTQYDVENKSLFNSEQMNLLSRKRESVKPDINDLGLLSNKGSKSQITCNHNNNYNLNILINSRKDELEDHEAEAVKKNLFAQSASKMCLYNQNERKNSESVAEEKISIKHEEPEELKELSKKRDDLKAMSLDVLATKIDSFCQLTQDFSNNFPNSNSKETKEKEALKSIILTPPMEPKKEIKEKKLEEHSLEGINNFNSKLSKQIQSIAPNLQSNSNVKNLTVDAEKISSLLNQLNDLENLLHATKNELSRIETVNQDVGYSDKIETNLREYEMSLNPNKVIMKDDINDDLSQ